MTFAFRSLLSSPATWARLLTAVLAVVAVIVAVTVRSDSAFSGTTRNTGNSLAAGTVVLTDNDSGSALFSVTGLKPGDQVQKCITVTYTGTLTPSSPVRLYGKYLKADGTTAGSSALAPYLNLTLESAPSGTACAASTGWTSTVTGTTLDGWIGAPHSDYASGTSTAWTPTTGDARVYRITFTVVDDNNAQGLVAEPAFVWEARS